MSGEGGGGVEGSVNRRAGHVAVAHRGRTLVWGGYMENQVGGGDLQGMTGMEGREGEGVGQK